MEAFGVVFCSVVEAVGVFVVGVWVGAVVVAVGVGVVSEAVVVVVVVIGDTEDASFEEDVEGAEARLEECVRESESVEAMLESVEYSGGVEDSDEGVWVLVFFLYW